VQVFVPGFTVRELPVKLNNINAVKYREDGTLVALGYDGNIWLLSDTDGDGLEDKAAPFWNQPTLRAPIGLALTPPGYARGRGVFVPAKGKVSLIVDTNNDDFADEEIIVAQGWNELPHGVDALGAALDKDGNVYFGLGTANFTDGYLINRDTGRAQYDLKNERGTILKVSPDFQRREIVCTGIRFPVAMAFNAAGDLFTTDQEGATWLPNGNPFDELLHIQAGRHYGFPPRHPKHLPSVVDEPSVFNYEPQHQSTCGLNFNEPVNGGKTFGPPWWRGDAIVTGYSRGKLWRTKLVKCLRRVEPYLPSFLLHLPHLRARLVAKLHLLDVQALLQLTLPLVPLANLAQGRRSST
jgi:glucose/arabinose dehydrogenase